jgi:N-methylhydantoinase A
VYRREWLPASASFDGPAVIEQLDCTTLIEPGCRVERDRLGNLLILV